MYGGVAQKYCRYKIEGEPFKKGNFYYVRVVHPITKAVEEVRFYTDKKHAELMPSRNAEKTPLCKIFGFENENDEIVIIKKCWLTDEVAQQYFYNYPGKPSGWRGSALFGGCWYAPKDTAIPPVTTVANHIFKCSWTDWKKEARAHAIAIGASSDCVWLKGE